MTRQKAFSSSEAIAFKHSDNLHARTGFLLQIFSSVCWLIPLRINSRFGSVSIIANCSGVATA